MKKTGKKALWIVGMAALGLMLILGGYLYWSWPVYPSFENELDSITELRRMIQNCDKTEKLVVVDLADFGAATQTVYVYVDGKTRSASPYAAYVCSENAGQDTQYALYVRGSVQMDGETSYQYPPIMEPTEEVMRDGTSYRNMPIKQEDFHDVEMPDGTTVRRYMSLRMLCGGYDYSIGGGFDKENLSDEEIVRKEAALQALLYELADRIIDETPAA